MKAMQAVFTLIKLNGILQKIYFDDILYIEGMENYLNIVTAEKNW